MIKKLHKIAIIGAGPAGCSAAIALKNFGGDVIIFEKGTISKDKPCGDALIPATVRLLNNYGIDQKQIKSLGGFPFYEIELQDCFLKSRFLNFRTNPGWIIPRKILDQKLRDLAANIAQIFYETTVKDIVFESAKLNLVLQEKNAVKYESFDSVIIATGSGGKLSKKFKIDGCPIQTGAITQYISNKEVLIPKFKFLEEFISGYGWIFPGEKNINIGVCALSHTISRNLLSSFNQFKKEFITIEEQKMRGGPAKLWSGQGTTWHHNSGLVSCGDSAGLIDPFNGEGITAALLSGYSAGLTISNFLRSNRNPTYLEKYSHWIIEYFNTEYFGNRIKLCQILTRSE